MQFINYLVLSVALLLALVSCGKKETPAKPGDVRAGPRSCTAFVLRPSLAAKEIALPAELKPFEQVKIYARVAGYVKKIYVDIGDRVTAGQLLVEIDAPEQQMRLAELNERTQSAYAQYLTSKDEYDRAVQMSRSPGYMAEADVVRLRNKKMADSLSFEAVRLSWQQMNETANYLKIRSPFNGIVTARYVDAGELTGADGRQHLLELENNATLRLETAVPETYSTAILQDKQVAFTVPSLPGQEFNARFARRSNTLTENTKSELWQFDFPNRDGRLKSGMYANVKLKLTRPDSTFLIPADALVVTQEKQYVVRVEADTARFVPVRIGFAFKNRIEVFGELSSGDRIIQPASEQIKQGEKLVVNGINE
ncbi:MAG TPA: efflux RND transporter periplasmic adaptor subunit [Saprospiraceae bacterium]|nr:efflux RND transporter periplasmic adaptor subunit [Saprospiraceae bacterium]